MLLPCDGVKSKKLVIHCQPAASKPRRGLPLGAHGCDRTTKGTHRRPGPGTGVSPGQLPEPGDLPTAHVTVRGDVRWSCQTLCG